MHGRAWGLVVVLAFTACDRGTPSRPARDDAPGLALARDAGPPAPRIDRYCPGAERWPTGSRTCATDGECSANERCWPGDVPWARPEGACRPRGAPPGRECDADRPCRRGVCIETRGPDRCDRLTKCVERCTATSCPDGDRCGRDGRCYPKSCRAGYRCPADTVCDDTLADEHGCSPRRCTAGYACPANTRCANGDGADEHGCDIIPCWEGGACDPNETCERSDVPMDRGCRQRTCKTSTDCVCGECVQGICAVRPGVCGRSTAPVTPP